MMAELDFQDSQGENADRFSMPDPPLKFKPQISSDSNGSDASTTHSLEELSAPEFFEHQCTEIDAMTSRVVRESSIRKAISAAVADGQICVTVANPRSPDASLVAVSEQFEVMTGYSRCEILGKNCRFLNADCNVDAADLLRLRFASETGAPFTGVLENRRKSGELFLNLLDLRGLTVARNPMSGDELWFLIGLQADVTHLETAESQEARLSDMLSDTHEMVNNIRNKLADELSALAVSGALMSNFAVTEQGNYLRSRDSPLLPTEPDPEIWSLLATPQWRDGSNTTSRPWPFRPVAVTGISGWKPSIQPLHPSRSQQKLDEDSPRRSAFVSCLAQKPYAAVSVGALALVMLMSTKHQLTPFR